MQNWTNEMWLASAVGLVIGFVFAYLFIRFTKDSVKKQTATENELNKVKQQLESQNQQLEKHFSETATLFKNLAQDYQNLYRHLAKSSEQLLPQHQNTLFLQNFIEGDKSTEAKFENDDQPKDYTEGSSGLLKNDK